MTTKTQNLFDSEDSEALLFAEEDSKISESEADPWKIMLVDDEESIHNITRLALNEFSFEGKTAEFMSAYSMQQATEMIQSHSDVALILLDVVMETDDAGLNVARYIRETLGNKLVRIVLRTGQPGRAPEQRVIVDYDINDYKTKTDLTNKKLFTTVVTALRAFNYIRTVENQRQELSELYNKLEEYNRTLEQKVEERTEQLFQAHLEAEKAKEREKRLEQQVLELKIKIDKAQQARQVSEITDTAYFKQLRQKARELRGMLKEADDEDQDQD